MRSCSNCNTPLDPEGRFCGACGHDNGELLESIPARSGGKSSRRIPRWIIVVGVIVILMCCAITTGGFVLAQMIEGLDFSDLDGLLESGELIPGPDTPSASTQSQIYDVWIDHNVEYEGQNFMIFHIEHEIYQADSTTGAVVILIWLEDGTPMASYDPDYDVAGQAAVLDLADVSFSPSTSWADYQLWIPYSALEAGEGHYATVELEDLETGRVLDAWRTESFDVLQ